MLLNKKLLVLALMTLIIKSEKIQTKEEGKKIVKKEYRKKKKSRKENTLVILIFSVLLYSFFIISSIVQDAIKEFTGFEMPNEVYLFITTVVGFFPVYSKEIFGYGVSFENRKNRKRTRMGKVN